MSYKNLSLAANTNRVALISEYFSLLDKDYVIVVASERELALGAARWNGERFESLPVRRITGSLRN